MKKVIRLSLLLATAMFATTIYAQQGPPPAGPPQGGPAAARTSRLDAISKAADLSAAQRTKVAAILKNTDKEIAESRKETHNTWGPKAKAQMNAIFAREEKSILAVLNDSQKPKYEAYFTAWKAERAKDKH